MSYVTNRERTDRGFARYGYPTICGQPNLSKVGNQIPDEVRNVTSWRGPMSFVQVGNKRRRRFNSFHVFYYKHYGERSIDTWCPEGAPGHTLYGEDILFSWYRGRWEQKYLGNPTSCTLDTKWPIAGEEYHMLEADKYRNEIVMDLFVKLNEPRWNGAVFFAELLETLVSIKELLGGAVKVFLKSGEALKRLKSFSLNSEELWLWYRYCLMPAMLDANDLLSAIKAQVKIDRCQTGKSKIKYTNHGTIKSLPYWFPPHNVSLEMPWTQSVNIGVGSAMDILHRFDPNEWGFGAQDILRAGWEIIPFSFIFDWFVGVGDFLTTCREVEIEQAQSYASYAIETKLNFFPGPDVEQSVPPVVYHRQIDRIIDLEPPTSPMVNSTWMNCLRTVDSISLAAGMIKTILSGKRRH